MIKKVNDIQSLRNFTDEIGSRSKHFVQDFPGLLYHYTDLNALISILSNHDLWLTNSRFSNDDHEITHGYEIALSVIKEKRGQSNNPEFKKYCDEVEELLSEPPQGVYICCFCEKDNLLSQWRSYGENGSGISIGFDPYGFTRFTGPDLPTDEIGLMRLWKVFYKDEVKKDIVEKALDMNFEGYSNDPENRTVQTAAESIHFFMPTFKDKDFAEENERRLIFTPSKDCQVLPSYRFGREMLVPYYSLQSLIKYVTQTTDPLPVKTVTVGPGIRKNINKESIEMMLPQKDYSEVTVKVSDTPYRG